MKTFVRYMTALTVGSMAGSTYPKFFPFCFLAVLAIAAWSWLGDQLFESK